MTEPATAPLSYADLISAAGSGDAAAYGTLYERHVLAARRVAAQMVRAPADVDDVVAETFARMLRLIRRVTRAFAHRVGYADHISLAASITLPPGIKLLGPTGGGSGARASGQHGQVRLTAVETARALGTWPGTQRPRSMSYLIV